MTSRLEAGCRGIQDDYVNVTSADHDNIHSVLLTEELVQILPQLLQSRSIK